MVYLIESTSPGPLVEDIKKVCKHGPVTNVTLALTIDLPISGNAFLSNYKSDADNWQAKERPDHLSFNHGEYMHRHADSVQFLIDQIRQKSTSNRACINLVDMRDISESSDGRLPSFMLLQAGIGEDPRRLLLTAYYRALEVGTFLPINLAELASIADRIQQGLPTLETAEMTIHAFRTHLTPGFRPHVRSKLDRANVDSVKAAADTNDYTGVADWLIDKARPETIIETSGLTLLLTEIKDQGWNKDVIDVLGMALIDLVELQDLRLRASHAKAIESRQESISEGLNRAARMLRRIAANKDRNNGN